MPDSVMIFSETSDGKCTIVMKNAKTEEVQVKLTAKASYVPAVVGESATK